MKMKQNQSLKATKMTQHYIFDIIFDLFCQMLIAILNVELPIFSSEWDFVVICCRSSQTPAVNQLGRCDLNAETCEQC